MTTTHPHYTSGITSLNHERNGESSVLSLPLDHFRNVLIMGGGGTGKTTLLNIILKHIPLNLTECYTSLNDWKKSAQSKINFLCLNVIPDGSELKKFSHILLTDPKFSFDYSSIGLSTVTLFKENKYSYVLYTLSTNKCSWHPDPNQLLNSVVKDEDESEDGGSESDEESESGEESDDSIVMVESPKLTSLSSTTEVESKASTPLVVQAEQSTPLVVQAEQSTPLVARVDHGPQTKSTFASETSTTDPFEIPIPQPQKETSNVSQVYLDHFISRFAKDLKILVIATPNNFSRFKKLERYSSTSDNRVVTVLLEKSLVNFRIVRDFDRVVLTDDSLIPSFELMFGEIPESTKKNFTTLVSEPTIGKVLWYNPQANQFSIMNGPEITTEYVFYPCDSEGIKFVVSSNDLSKLFDLVFIRNKEEARRACFPLSENQTYPCIVHNETEKVLPARILDSSGQSERAPLERV